VGRPTQQRLAIRYTEESSKAVAFYELGGVPLIPVQLYEAGLGSALFALLAIAPATAFGTGRLFGGLLLGLALGRSALMRLRYRRPDERAGPRMAGALNAAAIALGGLLLGGAAAALRDVGPASAATPPAPSLAFSISIAAA